MSTADSSTSRDEILANFQALAGIDDLGKAFTVLESVDWDMTEAVNKTLSEDNRQEPEFAVFNDHGSPSFSSFPTPFPAASANQMDVGVQNFGSSQEKVPSSFTNHPPVKNRISSVSEPSNIASSSSSSSYTNLDVLDINIKILSDGVTDGNSFPLELPASTTVGELQTLLHQLVGIPPCSQFLEGFLKPVDPQTVITHDILPKNMSLSLNTSSSTYNQFQKHNGSVSNDELNLIIHDEKNGKDFNLQYPSSKLVREIKTDIFHLTSIPVRHQVWTGWPSELGENSTLASLGISNNHHLKVGQVVPVPSERNLKLQNKPMASTSRSGIGDASEENSSADEFEDASDLLPEEDFLIMCDVPSSSQSSQPLIPPNVEDEMAGVLSFVEKFHSRYGTCIPVFFQGTLETALKESVMLPAKDRKPLAVYLHHDESVLANVFCSQYLCDTSVVDFLTNNFVIWGWDLSHESNKIMLLNLITSHFGTMAASTIRSYNTDMLPALLIINRSRGAIEILSVIHGNSILGEVMTTLLHANEIFEEQRKAEVLEEDLREQRETMKAEQDAAYHASLEADRAKAQAKRRAELEEQVERERQQSIKEQEDALKEAMRASLEIGLPPEPGADCSEATTLFRFRVPKEETFTRAFTRKTPLQIVLNFLCVKGFPPDEFKYIQSWPRRCITTLNTSKTLDELQMPAQETITVEERTTD